MNHLGPKNSQIDETKENLSQFFPVIIEVVGVTILKVILRFAQNGPNCIFRISVLVFVIGVIWHTAEGYNCNIM